MLNWCLAPPPCTSHRNQTQTWEPHRRRKVNRRWRSPKTKLQPQEQEVLNLGIPFPAVTQIKILMQIHFQIQIPVKTLTLTRLIPKEDPKENRARDAPTTHRFTKQNPKIPHASASPERSSKVALSWSTIQFLGGWLDS